MDPGKWLPSWPQGSTEAEPERQQHLLHGPAITAQNDTWWREIGSGQSPDLHSKNCAQSCTTSRSSRRGSEIMTFKLFTFKEDLQIQTKSKWLKTDMAFFLHFSFVKNMQKNHILWHITNFCPSELKVCFVQCAAKHTGLTYQVWWWTVWWFLLYSQEEGQHLPTLSQVLRGDQTVSIRCLLNTELSGWAYNKLVHKNIDRSHFVIFKSMLFHTSKSECLRHYHVYLLHTYTCYQDPGQGWTGRSTNSFSQTFCSIDATGE